MRDDDESLPFDVEREHLPVWAHVSSAIVFLVGLLAAARIAPTFVLLPFLVTSSIGKRFASSATHVEVNAGGLDLGGRAVRRAEILDVWVDDDETEPRVTVAFGEDVELAILHFPNREQARRFGEELAPPATSPEGGERGVVAGHKPRPVDALASLRFVAIAAAFVGTGAWYGLFVLVFFGLGAYALLRAKQVIAKEQGFEIRTALGARAHAYTDVEGVDIEAGVIRLKDGRAIHVPRPALRDTTLASPAWLDRARIRVLRRIQAGA